MKTLILAAVAAAALAGPALANPATAIIGEEPSQKTISAKGVNFNNPAEVSTFYIKVQNAARAVCYSDTADFIAALDEQRCVHQNMDNISRAIGAPKLTAMVAKNYGGMANSDYASR